MGFIRRSVFVCLAFASALAFAQSGEIAIDGVVPGGPAAEAGIAAEDVVVALDGREVDTFEVLDAVLKAAKPGDVLRVRVSRGEKILELPVTLGKRPDGGASLGVMLRIGAPLPPSADRAIDAEERREVLRGIAANLREAYLYEDKGRELAAKVERAAEKDRFAAAENLKTFVAAVNDYLLEIGNDKHLRIGYLRPSQGHGPVGPVVIKKGRGGPAAKAPHGAAGSAPDGNYGIREARVLDGNVGYLDLAMFTSDESAKTKVDDAMLALKDADALIIDLGRNGGGAPWMVRYLSGFLFDGPRHLTDTWARGMETPSERWTLQGQPTDAFHSMPVFVLTSGRTFSAAESFTFGLKINDRITIVGERTGGGGHFGDDVPLNDELRMFLPSGRTYDPETGKGWEAEGIAPDIEVPYSEARARAVAEAKKAASRGA